MDRISRFIKIVHWTGFKAANKERQVDTCLVLKLNEVRKANYKILLSQSGKVKLWNKVETGTNIRQ